MRLGRRARGGGPARARRRRPMRGWRGVRDGSQRRRGLAGAFPSGACSVRVVRESAGVVTTGLTAAEAERRLQERGPLPEAATSRSYRSIAVANTFTVFNLILAVFGAATIVFGNPKDALFLGILVANVAIGTFQEVRAKRALDKLAALVVAKATVVRDGAARQVPVGEVVVGDLVRVGSGDQLPADGE